MNVPSRRQLANYGMQQLLLNKPAKLVAKQLAAILIITKRSKEADLLAADIAWSLEKHGLLAQTKITTAKPLSDTLRRLIIRALKQKTQVDQVVLDEQLSEEVVGGIRLETAAHSWDKTIAKELKGLREVS